MVGGTKDLLKPLAQAFDKVATDSSRSVVVVLTNKLFGATQQVAYGQLIDKESTTCKRVTTIFFGVHGEDAAQEAINKDIQLDTERTRFVGTRSNVDDLVDLFDSQVLSSEEVQQAAKVLIHIDMESISEADGVTEFLPDTETEACFGSFNIQPHCPKFRAFDICNIVQMCARVLPREKLGCVSVSDFNAVVEDQKTGHIICQMFYNVVLGICQQKKAN